MSGPMHGEDPYPQVPTLLVLLLVVGAWGALVHQGSPVGLAGLVLMGLGAGGLAWWVWRVGKVAKS